MTAQASLPAASPKSSTDSLVIAAVTMVPPNQTRTTTLDFPSLSQAIQDGVGNNGSLGQRIEIGRRPQFHAPVAPPGDR